jgi:hypothetical protein
MAVKSASEFDLTIWISPSAAPGSRTIGVVNSRDGGRGRCPGCFGVDRAPGE